MEKKVKPKDEGMMLRQRLAKMNINVGLNSRPSANSDKNLSFNKALQKQSFAEPGIKSSIFSHKEIERNNAPENKKRL